MRPLLRSRSIAPLAFLASLLGTSSAYAGSMDPTPERLILQPPGLPSGTGGSPPITCQDVANNPELVLAGGLGRPSQFACRPNNGAFRNLVSELGYAIAPSMVHPARTTGYSGFVISLGLTLTTLHSDGTAADGTPYWRLGTQGPEDTGSQRFATQNSSPASVLPIYELTIRKGLPLGFEVGGAMGLVGSSSMAILGGDVRWALFEGFRKGVLGVLPDVAAGAGVRSIVGSSKMYLTTVGIHAVVSKPFTINDMSSLSPFVGYQRLLIFGNSGIVDLTPNVDALQRCGYDGPDPTTGAPVCRNKLSNGFDNNVDFNNSTTFDSVKIHRNRLVMGATYRYELFHAGAQLSTDLTSPSGEGNQVTGGAQWTFALQGGVAF